MKLHLVDGTYELFRAFYGPPSYQHQGREVGATRALTRSLLHLLTGEGATHVGVAFDTRIESFRNDLFDGYKTGEGIDKDLWEQFPLAEQAAEALGLVVWRMIEFEADDALCAMAAKARGDKRVEQVVLCSPDKDLYQCVDDERVVVYDRMRNKTFDTAAVIEKMGVPPAAIPDYLALVGDSADGIPGIPRWGAKSTGALLTRYGSLENIPDDESTWDLKVRGAAGLAENLRNQREEASLYKTLATLRDDVPLTESPDDLEWKGANEEKLDALLEVTGDTSIKDRVPRWQGGGSS